MFAFVSPPQRLGEAGTTVSTNLVGRSNGLPLPWFNGIVSFLKIWERALSPNSSMRLPQKTLTLCREIGFIRPLLLSF